MTVTICQGNDTYGIYDTDNLKSWYHIISGPLKKVHTHTRASIIMNERKHRKKKKKSSQLILQCVIAKEIGIAYLSFTDKPVLKTSKWHHSSWKTCKAPLGLNSATCIHQTLMKNQQEAHIFNKRKSSIFKIFFNDIKKYLANMKSNFIFLIIMY